MRAFIALNFSRGLKQQLWECTAALRDNYPTVRWIAADSCHLTLQFLGKSDEVLLPRIQSLLDELCAKHRSFDVAINDVQAFPSARRPRVVWVGCDGGVTLELIQNDVAVSLAELGFTPDGKPFRPHITLGRARRGAAKSELWGLGEALEQVQVFGSDSVETVDLMRSTLLPSGARYEIIHRAQLLPRV